MFRTSGVDRHCRFGFFVCARTTDLPHESVPVTGLREINHCLENPRTLHENEADASTANRNETRLRRLSHGSLPHTSTTLEVVPVKFSIITPSFRNSDWLKLCIASVADQKDVEHEHIVQDSCSDDGTQNWLPNDRRVQAFIEKDTGMYDAINRGIRRSSGDVVAYLNCDEQYLPGALKAVHDLFERHAEVDIVAGHFVVVDGSHNYLCHRHAMVPKYPEAWYRFSPSTCAIFCRRRVFADRDLWFDTQFRAVSDAYWLLNTLRAGCRWSVLPQFTSAFADHGENLILSPKVKHEIDHYFSSIPRWVRWTKPFWVNWYRLRMLRSGVFQQTPFNFSIFTPASPAHRVTVQVEKPNAIWRGRG